MTKKIWIPTPTSRIRPASTVDVALSSWFYARDFRMSENMQVGRRRTEGRRERETEGRQYREGGKGGRSGSVEMTKSYIAVSANWVIFPHCFLPLYSAKSRRTHADATGRLARARTHVASICITAVEAGWLVGWLTWRSVIKYSSCSSASSSLP